MRQITWLSIFMIFITSNMRSQNELAYYFCIEDIASQIDTNSISGREKIVFIKEKVKEYEKKTAQLQLDYIEENIKHFENDSIDLQESFKVAAILSKYLGYDSKSIEYKEKYINQVFQYDIHNYRVWIDRDEIFDYCSELVYYYLDKEQFDRSKYFISLIENNYITDAHIGYYEKSFKKKIDFLYTDFYNKKEDFKEAMKYIVTYLFDEDFTYDREQKENRIKSSLKLLLKVYEKDFLIQEFKKSYKNPYLKNIGPYSYPSELYFIKFLGYECEIQYHDYTNNYSPEIISSKNEKKDIEDIIKKHSYFYSLLKKE